MKIFKLIFFNIYKLFKESSSIPMFILSGIIFASFGIFFYSGYFIYNYYDTNYLCEIDINIDDKKNTSNIKSLIDKIIIENSFNSVVIADNSVNSPESIKITGLYENEMDKHLLYGSAYKYDEKKSNVILSERAVNQLGFNENITGEKINYELIDYNVLGINTGMYDFCVSPYFYIDNFETKFIHAEFDAIISPNLKNFLENECFYFNIKKNNSPFNSPEFLFGFFIVIAVFTLSFINILIMFAFWNIKMKQTFRVYYIYGCNNIQKFFVVSGQVFFISLFGTIIGFIAFLSVYKKLGELTIVYAESIKNYVIILLFTILMLLLLSFYYGIKVSKTQEVSFRAKE